MLIARCAALSVLLFGACDSKSTSGIDADATKIAQLLAKR